MEHLDPQRTFRVGATMTADGEAHPNSESLVHAFVDAIWNGNDLDALEQLTTEDVVIHGLGAGVDRTGPEFRDFHTGLLEAVPDLEHELNTLVIEGDRAVAYLAIRGTPERQYGALSPTGKSFDSVAFQMYRFDDDRIAEVWVLPNAMGMLGQLGIFPNSPGDVLRLLFRVAKGKVFGR